MNFNSPKLKRKTILASLYTSTNIINKAAFPLVYASLLNFAV